VDVTFSGLVEFGGDGNVVAHRYLGEDDGDPGSDDLPGADPTIDRAPFEVWPQRWFM
jgi:hypothetical protein